MFAFVPHNLLMATFSKEILDRLRDVREIEIETTRKSGETKRTIIWLVVEGEDVFVRSEFGDDGWWYRRLKARPEAVVHLRRQTAPPIPVRAIPADDPASIERCSAAIRDKYPPGGSVNAMLKPEIVHATLRLEPA
jgi:hypothetical protein